MFSKFTRQIQDMQKKMLEAQERLRTMELEAQVSGGGSKAGDFWRRKVAAHFYKS